jgi:hypothetical protein
MGGAGEAKRTIKTPKVERGTLPIYLTGRSLKQERIRSTLFASASLFAITDEAGLA